MGFEVKSRTIEDLTLVAAKAGIYLKVEGDRVTEHPDKRTGIIAVSPKGQRFVANHKHDAMAWYGGVDKGDSLRRAITYIGWMLEGGLEPCVPAPLSGGCDICNQFDAFIEAMGVSIPEIEEKQV